MCRLNYLVVRVFIRNHFQSYYKTLLHSREAVRGSVTPEL